MPSYSTNLKQWGSSGSIWPDGYSYAEGEQPVDEWDNYFNSKVYNDITHLISVTNNDLLTVDGEHDLEGDTTITDGTRAYFGTSENFSIRYSASSNELLIVDEISSTTSLTLTESGVVEYKGDEVVSNRDQITISGGDGLKNGNTINPVGGGTLSLDIEPADFAGTGLEDDGSDNLRISSSSIGDGLSGGSGSTINIKPADFAGENLSDDGSGNLKLNDSIQVQEVAFDDADGDGSNWSVGENATSGRFEWTSVNGGGVQMNLENNGNLQIEGEITENASL